MTMDMDSLNQHLVSLVSLIFLMTLLRLDATIWKLLWPNSI